MAKIAFAILGLTLMLNLATGMVFTLVPELDVPEYNTKYTYNATASTLFVDPLEKELQPSGGPVESYGDSIWRVLDMINIGFINNFLSGIQNYLFGFIKFLGIALQPLLTETMFALLFKPFVGLFYVIISIIYVIGGFSLWTGKDISGR